MGSLSDTGPREKIWEQTACGCLAVWYLCKKTRGTRMTFQTRSAELVVLVATCLVEVKMEFPDWRDDEQYALALEIAMKEFQKMYPDRFDASGNLRSTRNLTHLEAFGFSLAKQTLMRVGKAANPTWSSEDAAFEAQAYLERKFVRLIPEVVPEVDRSYMDIVWPLLIATAPSTGLWMIGFAWYYAVAMAFIVSFIIRTVLRVAWIYGALLPDGLEFVGRNITSPEG